MSQSINQFTQYRPGLFAKEADEQLATSRANYRANALNSLDLMAQYLAAELTGHTSPQVTAPDDYERCKNALRQAFEMGARQ